MCIKNSKWVTSWKWMTTYHYCTDATYIWYWQDNYRNLHCTVCLLTWNPVTNWDIQSNSSASHFLHGIYWLQVTKVTQLQQMNDQLQQKDGQIQQMNDQLQQKDGQIRHKDGQIQQQATELREKTLELSRQLRELQTLRVRERIFHIIMERKWLHPSMLWWLGRERKAAGTGGS